MTRSQYWILIVGLVVVAWLLNVALCDWVFTKSIPSTSGRDLLVWDHGNDPNYPPHRHIHVVTGLFVTHDVPVPIAGTFGVALPVAMLFTAAFLFVSARQSGRRAAGQCLKCGHQLAGLAVCPECGTADQRKH